MTLNSLSNFITTLLGRMKGVFLSTSHLRTLYIENHRPVKLFTYMYIMGCSVQCTWESFDWFVTLFSNKKDEVWLPNQVYKWLLTEWAAVRRVVPPQTIATAPRGLRIAQNWNERTIQLVATREWLSALRKIAVLMWKMCVDCTCTMD